ncbi:hypothetical protein [Lysobacter brunescens]|uniref:Lipoprotein n=1 Tax=Lysobacter brunescens TaxID=262323 RepID=A0ABW2Y965_9GAMM
MKRIAECRIVALMACALLLSACSPGDVPVTGKSPVQASQSDPLESPKAGDESGIPTNMSKRRLPAHLMPVAGAPHFGIALDSLDAEGRAIVQAASADYAAILAGGMPDCRVALAASDGGTTIHFCDGYNIARIHSMDERDGVDGFKYGVMLDFLNGRKLESLRFLSNAQMRALEAAAKKR